MPSQASFLCVSVDPAWSIVLIPMPPFSVFDRASPELMRWMESIGISCSVQATNRLIREGDFSARVLVLLEGCLSVTTSDAQQRLNQLATVEPGGLVGEMSWLEQRPAVANITAEIDSTVLELPTQDLDQLELQHPAMAAELHRLIAQKLAVQIQRQNAWVHRLTTAPFQWEALRKVLMLFASLEEQDVHRLASLGKLEIVQADSELLQQGAEVPALYLILSGEAEILLTRSGTTQLVGSSRRGELLGEMTLLLDDQMGASAGVRSEQGMDLLSIERPKLQAELKRNPAFASRFFRGVACMLSQRSRDQLHTQKRAASSYEAEQNALDQLDLNQLEAISRAARHFDWLCRHFQSGAPLS